jgi:hypothetical protein
MTRAEKAAEARRLRDQGLLLREIGARMGLSVSMASDLINDPDGSKVRARKASYGGRCDTCGRRTDGSNGRAKAPTRCAPCEHANPRHRYWTRELVIDAIREFARLYGRPPAATDWNPAHARNLGHPEKIDRFYDDACWPSSVTVLHIFDSWNTAITAAGHTPRKTGVGVGQREWDAGAVIAEIRRLAVNGTPPSSRQNRTLATIAQKYHGSWNNAVRAAGFAPRPQGRKAA